MFDKTSGYSDLAKFQKFTIEARVFRGNKEICDFRNVSQRLVPV